MYLKQIEQLVALQRVDSEILLLKGEQESAPKEISTLVDTFASLEEQVQQYDEKIRFLREQETKTSREIEDDGLRIKKSKNKLMMASNTKEYHAMMREVDNLEKLNRHREEERATLEEELQRQETGLVDVQARSGTLKEELDQRQASLQDRIAKIEARLAELDKQRKSANKHVPPPILGRYEFIRSRLAPPVIVPVVGGICSGCNISIPPQSYNELQKGQQILSCPNCQRLIYWCEHFTEVK